MRILRRAEIEAAMDTRAAIAVVSEGFVAFSRGEVETPPVGHLAFTEPPADVHIKYGYRRGAAEFVVKISSGFYENPASGLSSSSGLMLVFSATTGFPKALLLDEGYLTDLRTAAAGAVAAKLLAPKHVDAIGVLGAGIQAHMQLDLLREVIPCRRAIVWARDPLKARTFAVDGFDMEVADSASQLASRCNLIVTTTPARGALFPAAAVRPGTHITAVGADAPGKQELDPELFARADVLCVDSHRQCLEYGDSSHAVRAGLVSPGRFVELGEVLATPSLGRTHAEQISICDLTGLAIQDIQISRMICERLGIR